MESSSLCCRPAVISRRGFQVGALWPLLRASVPAPPKIVFKVIWADKVYSCTLRWVTTLAQMHLGRQQREHTFTSSKAGEEIFSVPWEKAPKPNTLLEWRSELPCCMFSRGAALRALRHAWNSSSQAFSQLLLAGRALRFTGEVQSRWAMQQGKGTSVWLGETILQPGHGESVWVLFCRYTEGVLQRKEGMQDVSSMKR